MDSSFGKMSLAAKAMKLKYRKDISLQEAWDEVLGKKRKTTKKTTKKPTKKPTKKAEKKTTKKTNDKLSSMTVPKLKKLAIKNNISIYDGKTKKMLTKDKLINRLKRHKVSFGQHQGTSLSLLPSVHKPVYSQANYPEFNSWMDSTLANTPTARQTYYDNLPLSNKSFNHVNNVNFNQGSLLPSTAPFGNVSNFGQYFR